MYPLNKETPTKALDCDASHCEHSCLAEPALGRQVSLEVRGKHTLEESLDFYVQGELMEGDNQYECEEAGCKVHYIPYLICLPVTGHAHVGLRCLPELSVDSIQADWAVLPGEVV